MLGVNWENYLSIRRLVLPLLLLSLTASWSPLPGQQADFSFQDAQTLLETNCAACHGPRGAQGRLNVAALTPDSLSKQPRVWHRILTRVRQGEMPPKGAPAPAVDLREKFVGWVENSLRAAACANGVSAGPAPLRRLNRNEYAATVRELFNVHFNAGQALPADGAGGEGFDNAAETLFLSPVHAEKYLEAAKQALDYASKEPRSRTRFLVAEPGKDLTAEQAAQKTLKAFLPRAFRRPVTDIEADRYVELFRIAQKRGDSYEQSILYALQGVLISPYFLFRIEEPNPGPEMRLLGGYEMATRLSYFLWGTMPDETLMGLAAKGTLNDPETLKAQVQRMLKDQRSTAFAEQFIEQWLGTRELGNEAKPDAKLFPEYGDAELQAIIRYETYLFFQEMLINDLPLLNLIDSKWTIANDKLQKLYQLNIRGLGQQNKKADLPDGSPRGGLLTMAAVLTVSSYPHRTSPVLRGKWVLETILGTPPAPPPPDVPSLKEEQSATPATLREKLMLHRQNAVCASCHNRIDPIGFGLENFDPIGRWRSEDAGKAIDAKGELPDGTAFNGPVQLKAMLLERKDQFIRNLTTKMLAYGLGRGLTFEDDCTIEQIVEQLKKSDYSSQALIREVVLSVPFRYQAGTARPK